MAVGTPPGGVTSFKNRVGAITPATGDYTKAQVGLDQVLDSVQLVAASNLSDLTDASAARTHLGLNTAATHPASDFTYSSGDGSIQVTGTDLAVSSAYGVVVSDAITAGVATVVPKAHQLLTSGALSVSGGLANANAMDNPNNTITLPAATGSVPGSMSAADKAKLDAAASADTVSTLVIRDGSGNFAAGTITAALSGNATTATTAGTISGTITESQVVGLTVALATFALQTITITPSGTGLSGGGNLSTNRAITFDQTAITVAESQVTNLSTDLAARPPLADVEQLRGNRVVAVWNANANTDAARGAALRAAMNAAVSGDHFKLQPVNYDVTVIGFSTSTSGIINTVSVSGSTLGDFVFAAGVTVEGVWGRTQLTSQVSGDNISNLQFVIADGLYLLNVWINLPLTALNAYQVGLGTQSEIGPVTAKFRGVKITGHSDCVYFITHTSNISCTFIDCDFNSVYDCLAMLGNGSDNTIVQCSFYGCRFTTIAPSVSEFTAAGIVHCALVEQGTARFKGCSFKALNGTTGDGYASNAAETVGVLAGYALGASSNNYHGTVEVDGGCHFNVSQTSGTGRCGDVIVTQNTATAIVSYGGNVGSQPNYGLTTMNQTATLGGASATGDITFSEARPHKGRIQLFSNLTMVVSSQVTDSVPCIRIPIPRAMAGKCLRYAKLVAAVAGSGGITSVQITRERGGLFAPTTAAFFSTKLQLAAGSVASDDGPSTAYVRAVTDANTTLVALAAEDFIRIDVPDVPATAPIGLWLEVEFW